MHIINFMLQKLLLFLSKIIKNVNTNINYSLTIQTDILPFLEECTAEVGEYEDDSMQHDNWNMNVHNENDIPIIKNFLQLGIKWEVSLT